MKRFAIRTIKHGQVKIFGKIFRPDEELAPQGLPYTGQLDGLRYAFGLYYPPNDKKTFVSLWGPEAFYYAKSEKEREALWEARPEVIDGILHWQWWHEI